MRLLACTDVALLLASLTPCWPSADGDIDSAACSSGTDHRPPPTASWSDTSHPFAALAGENAAPFLLQGSPAESWPAHSRWTPTYLNAKLTEVPTVRRARQPRLLFFTIDQFSAEFARNEDFWRLADAETAAERAGGQRGVLSGSSLALKNFRWSKLHQLHEAVPASKVTKALQRTGPSTAGSSTWYTYAAVDVYASQQVHTLLEDVSPLAGLGARREDDPRRWRASIWLGSENTTATPHYDSYHNIVVQIYGRKLWKIVPPAALRRQPIFPLGHPSARQLQETDFDILADARKRETDVDQSQDWFEFIMGPGDVLCLPAYWLHEVTTLPPAETDGTDIVGGGSISFNTWQVSEPQAAIFGQPGLLFANGAGSGLESEQELRAVLSAVVVGTLRDGLVPGLCGGGAGGGADCVADFFAEQLSLRWEPLLPALKDGNKLAAYTCAEPWSWNSDVAGLLPEQSGRSTSSKDTVAKLIETFRGVEPRAMAPSLLMDWGEALCYTFMATGVKVRDCPFFFAACLT